MVPMVSLPRLLVVLVSLAAVLEAGVAEASRQHAALRTASHEGTALGEKCCCHIVCEPKDEDKDWDCPWTDNGDYNQMADVFMCPIGQGMCVREWGSWCKVPFLGVCPTNYVGCDTCELGSSYSFNDYECPADGTPSRGHQRGIGNANANLEVERKRKQERKMVRQEKKEREATLNRYALRFMLETHHAEVDYVKSAEAGAFDSYASNHYGREYARWQNKLPEVYGENALGRYVDEEKRKKQKQPFMVGGHPMNNPAIVRAFDADVEGRDRGGRTNYASGY